LPKPKYLSLGGLTIECCDIFQVFHGGVGENAKLAIPGKKSG
jgi:hypothetical protein